MKQGFAVASGLFALAAVSGFEGAVAPAIVAFLASVDFIIRDAR